MVDGKHVAGSRSFGDLRVALIGARFVAVPSFSRTVREQARENPEQCSNLDDRFSLEREVEDPFPQGGVSCVKCDGDGTCTSDDREDP